MNFENEEFGFHEPREDFVDVQYGIFMHSLPLAGFKVGEVRTRFAEMLNLDPEAKSVIDGNVVDDETVLVGGQLLCFIRPAGVMGLH